MTAAERTTTTETITASQMGEIERAVEVGLTTANAAQLAGVSETSMQCAIANDPTIPLRIRIARLEGVSVMLKTAVLGLLEREGSKRGRRPHQELEQLLHSRNEGGA